MCAWSTFRPPLCIEEPFRPPYPHTRAPEPAPNDGKYNSFKRRIFGVDKTLFKLRRRDFLKTSAAAAVGSVLPVCGIIEAGDRAVAQSAPDRKASGRDPVHDVLPIIGTGWHGHMFPGAVAPFGLVQLSPDTSGPPEPKWNEKWDLYRWDHCSGYHYPDNVVVGFSHTHVQGTGGSGAWRRFGHAIGRGTKLGLGSWRSRRSRPKLRSRPLVRIPAGCLAGRDRAIGLSSPISVK